MTASSPFKILRLTTLLAAIALTLGACATKPTAANLADSLARNPSLSTFSSLVAQGSLSATLQSGGPFTVFAPTNEAFKAVPAATMADLNKHPEKLKAVLSHHITAGKLLAADIKNSSSQSLQGSNLGLSKAGDYVIVESATVVAADTVATNGVIHTIDTVLMPPKK